MSNKDKTPDIISLIDRKKEKNKPDIFKSGVNGEWKEYPHTLESKNMVLRDIAHILKTTSESINIIISNRRDIQDCEAVIDRIKDNFCSPYGETQDEIIALKKYNEALSCFIKENFTCLIKLLKDNDIINIQEILDDEKTTQE